MELTAVLLKLHLWEKVESLSGWNNPKESLIWRATRTSLNKHSCHSLNSSGMFKPELFRELLKKKVILKHHVSEIQNQEVSEGRRVIRGIANSVDWKCVDTCQDYLLSKVM